jgi:hypothetical protein
MCSRSSSGPSAISANDRHAGGRGRERVLAKCGVSEASCRSPPSGNAADHVKLIGAVYALDVGDLRAVVLSVVMAERFSDGLLARDPSD